MKRKTKKEMVLEIYDREAMGEVTAREIAMINEGLVAEFGEGGAMTPAEIARALVDEGLPVRYQQVFAMATAAERYQELLDGVLRLETLGVAEASIRRLDRLHRKFRRAGDSAGARHARDLAVKAKRALAQQGAAAGLAPERRAELAEVAQWLTVWLQTPDLFAQWLELRKAAPEFKRTFAQAAGREHG
jgi:hypothetical protein